ncbi:hypothetical protein LIANG_12605 [Enterococcus durans]|nr:hypothetical protein LIANG_12605 [Enterococcus durans]
MITRLFIENTPSSFYSFYRLFQKTKEIPFKNNKKSGSILFDVGELRQHLFCIKNIEKTP